MTEGGRILVVFDVDGTLIDSQRMICGAMALAFDTVGLPQPDRRSVLSIVGLSLPQAMERLVPDAPQAALAALVTAYKAAFGHLRAEDAAHLFPGAAEALARLSAREDVLLGIATGKSRRGLAHLLDAFGLTGTFATLQTADDHPSKPHPAMLLAALAEAAAVPARSVMVGDTTYDIDMARAAGMASIGVAWGYHDAAALRAAGASRVIDRFDALDRALDAALGASV
ncbi:MAG: HAD-IA family hydrolase [Methylobacterium organophilum]|nr:HAD-IA family hydrolase [Methylobacterium organophilum]